MKGHSFGGSWTEEKLELVRKYLVAYATIMNKQPYNFAYIDAFAGTGFYERKGKNENEDVLFLPEMADLETKQFYDGSAKIALDVKPSFRKYIFIEKDRIRIKELESLKIQHKDIADSIQIENAEANEYLCKMCSADWTKHRALVFLDPYGMQVDWDTIKAIANTKAIDLWILFPLGVAVNRVLKKDGNINEAWRERLNRLFGRNDWYNTFYRETEEDTLFGKTKKTEKIASFESISKYYVERLKEIFPGVADKPYRLENSKRNPLFMLCFASANPLGAKTAIKIANYILES